MMPQDPQERHPVSNPRGLDKGLNGTLPECFIFDSDFCVGEGDIEYFHSKEVRSPEAKLRDICHKKKFRQKLKLNSIDVSKRINTCIFSKTIIFRN